MKGLKLSKTSWLILSAGLFVVVLAGLGMTRSQQLQQLSTSTDQLQIATARLNKLDTAGLKAQAATLEQQVTVGKSDLQDAISRLNKSVVSADVAEEFYNIADSSGVTVKSFTSSPISSNHLQGIPVSATNISGAVSGTLQQVIAFISNLNTSFRTGYVESATIQIQAPPASGIDTDALAQSTIQLVIYSYTQ